MTTIGLSADSGFMSRMGSIKKITVTHSEGEQHT